MKHPNVTAHQLIAFAVTLDDQSLKTRARQKPFSIKVQDSDGLQTGRMLIFAPSSSRKSRKQQQKHIISVLEKFSKADDLEKWNVKTYGSNSINASYQLALMEAYFKHLNSEHSQAD
jgi:hypothetical protein